MEVSSSMGCTNIEDHQGLTSVKAIPFHESDVKWREWKGKMIAYGKAEGWANVLLSTQKARNQ
jgi:hypothetical protein